MARRRLNLKSRQERHSSKSKSATSKFKIGPITRNPFLNFLRDMRKAAHGMSITELASRGAELWRKMNAHQKKPYCELAKQAARTKRRRRRHRRRRGRRASSDGSVYESESGSPSRRKSSHSKRKRF